MPRPWTPCPQWRARYIGLDRGHPTVERLALAAEWLAKSYLENDTTHGDALMIAGNTGCGKTHAAKKVLAYVSARQISAWAAGKLGAVDHLGAPAFIRWDKAAELGDHEWKDLIDGDVKPARLVILDDIGSDTDRFKSGVPARRLKEVLDVSERKWLLVTTNIKRSDLKDQFGQRVADRLTRCRYLEMFEAPSYRGVANANKSDA